MATDFGVGDILTVRLEFKNADSVAYNLLHYKVQNVTDDSSGLPAAVRFNFDLIAPNINTSMFGVWGGAWAPAASEEVDMTGVTTQSVSPAPRSRPYTYVAPAPQPGVWAGDSLPLQDTPTILKQTAFGQRWGLGRMFFVGLAEGAQDKGIVIGIAVGNLNDFALQAKASVTVDNGTYTAQLQPVLYSRASTGLERITPITGARLSDTIIKTQRRRRPGKGI
jgi:hypothetical protein